MNAQQAYKAGFSDAVKGRFYLESAPAKSEILLNYRHEYHNGWEEGRIVKLYHKLGSGGCIYG